MLKRVRDRSIVRVTVPVEVVPPILYVWCSIRDLMTYKSMVAAPLFAFFPWNSCMKVRITIAFAFKGIESPRSCVQLLTYWFGIKFHSITFVTWLPPEVVIDLSSSLRDELFTIYNPSKSNHQNLLEKSPTNRQKSFGENFHGQNVLLAIPLFFRINFPSSITSFAINNYLFNIWYFSS